DLSFERVLDSLLEWVAGRLRWRQPGVFRADLAVARDEDADRKCPNRPVRILDVVVPQALQHGIVHLVFLGERLKFVDRVVDRHPDHLETILAILLLELDEARDLVLAGAAPGGPEV